MQFELSVNILISMAYVLAQYFLFIYLFVGFMPSKWRPEWDTWCSPRPKKLYSPRLRRAAPVLILSD